MRNRSFCGARRPRNAPKGSAERVQKRTPHKTRKSGFLGSCFGTFLGSLGASWPYLGELCCYLVASWPQRLTKGGPREAKRGPRGAQGSPREAQEPPKRGPRGAQVRPRGSQKCSGEPKRGPREPLTVPREPKTGRESSKESPRQRLNHVCKEGGLGGSFPPAL